MLTRVQGTTILAGLCVLALVIGGCGGTGGGNSQFDGGVGDDATTSSSDADDSTAPDAEIGFSTGDGYQREQTGASDATTPRDGCAGGSCFDGPVCGDGIVETGEQCDDGNTMPGDGCNGVCQVENGYVCPAAGGKCVLIATCGNGVLDPGEGCDDGNLKPGDGCSSACQVELGWHCSSAPTTSDAGTRDSGAGDAGPTLGPSVCVQDRCGDGILSSDIGETCDDGNTKSGDGCSSTCQIERGWSCATPDAPLRGRPVRRRDRRGEGDLRRRQHGIPGDGSAASTCLVEAGWTCPGTGGKCKTTCGDGIVAGNEPCDDGAANGAGNGCSGTCTVQPGYACAVANQKSVCTKTVCGNGKLEGTEECDDGNLVPYDGCIADMYPRAEVLGRGLQPHGRVRRRHPRNGRGVRRREHGLGRRLQLDLPGREWLDVQPPDAGAGHVADDPDPLPGHAVLGHVHEQRGARKPRLQRERAQHHRRGARHGTRGVHAWSRQRAGLELGRRGIARRRRELLHPLLLVVPPDRLRRCGVDQPVRPDGQRRRYGKPHDVDDPRNGAGIEHLHVPDEYLVLPARPSRLGPWYRSGATATRREVTRPAVPSRTATRSPRRRTGTTSTSRASSTTRSRTRRANRRRRPARRSALPVTTTSGLSSAASSWSTSGAFTPPRPRRTRSPPPTLGCSG